MCIVVATKDVTNDIRDRLYTGGWDTVRKNLDLIKEGKARAEDETILFAVELMTANKCQKIPDMSMFFLVLFFLVFVFFFFSFH
jgi:hypothetical protein